MKQETKASAVRHLPNTATAVFLACLCLFCSGAAHSQAQTINVYTEEFYPFQYYDGDGHLVGFSVDIVSQLFDLTGDGMNLQVQPWARAFNTVLQEKNAMLFSVARTAERANQFAWIGSLLKERQYFWGLKQQFPNNLTDITSLHAFSVGVTTDSNHDQFLSSINFPNIYRVTKIEQSTQMMFKGRVDLVIGSKRGMDSRCRKLALNCNLATPVLEVEALHNEFSLAFNANSDAVLIQRYREAFGQLVANGELETLKEAWGIRD